MNRTSSSSPAKGLLLLLAVELWACSGSVRAGAPAGPCARCTYTQDWFVGKVSWPELLAGYRGKPNVRYLEVGVFEGRSLIWMLDTILTGKGASAVAVDIFSGDYAKVFASNLRLSGHEKRVQVVKARSEVALRSLPARSFDIVFIDGSHAARDVLTDAVLSWQLLVEGGLLIWDDYGNERPRDELLALPKVPDELRPRVAIDAFLTAFRGELEVVQHDFQVTVRKLAPACHDWVCSAGRSWFYDWGKRRLYRRPTGDLIALTDEQRAELETLLATTPFGATEPLPSDACLAKPSCKSVMDALELRVP